MSKTSSQLVLCNGVVNPGTATVPVAGANVPFGTDFTFPGAPNPDTSAYTPFGQWTFTSSWTTTGGEFSGTSKPINPTDSFWAPVPNTGGPQFQLAQVNLIMVPIVQWNANPSMSYWAAGSHGFSNYVNLLADIFVGKPSYTWDQVDNFANTIVASGTYFIFLVTSNAPSAPDFTTSYTITLKGVPLSAPSASSALVPCGGTAATREFTGATTYGAQDPSTHYALAAAVVLSSAPSKVTFIWSTSSKNGEGGPDHQLGGASIFFVPQAAWLANPSMSYWANTSGLNPRCPLAGAIILNGSDRVTSGDGGGSEIDTIFTPPGVAPMASGAYQTFFTFQNVIVFLDNQITWSAEVHAYLGDLIQSCTSLVHP